MHKYISIPHNGRGEEIKNVASSVYVFINLLLARLPGAHPVKSGYVLLHVILNEIPIFPGRHPGSINIPISLTICNIYRHM